MNTSKICQNKAKKLMKDSPTPAKTPPPTPPINYLQKNQELEDLLGSAGDADAELGEIVIEEVGSDLSAE